MCSHIATHNLDATSFDVFKTSRPVYTPPETDALYGDQPRRLYLSCVRDLAEDLHGLRPCHAQPQARPSPRHRPAAHPPRGQTPSRAGPTGNLPHHGTRGRRLPIVRPLPASPRYGHPPETVAAHAHPLDTQLRRQRQRRTHAQPPSASRNRRHALSALPVLGVHRPLPQARARIERAWEIPCSSPPTKRKATTGTKRCWSSPTSCFRLPTIPATWPAGRKP